MLLIAAVFSLLYIAELLFFTVGPLKDIGGRGFGYLFTIVFSLLWIGFAILQKAGFRYKSAVLLVLGFFLTTWILPAWYVQIALERHAYGETLENARHTEVTDVTDEPLLDAHQKPIGVRLRYAIRFPKTALYPPSPTLTADNRQPMRVLAATITPMPEELRPDGMNTGVYGKYKTGIVYRFQVNLVPDFVKLSSDKTKSCFWFPNAEDKKALTAGDITVRFDVQIEGTNYGGHFEGSPQSTRNTYSLSDFYRNALANGTTDECNF